jgi:chorismate mutase
MEQHKSEGNAMMCRGVRGAITVQRNDADEILEATRELLQALVKANDMRPEDIASIYLTTTPDLNATYPAYAARQLGWYDMALLCGHEMTVPGGLERCVRVLIHWNTTRRPDEVVHVYLREARSLRPDRDNVPPVRPRQMNQIEAAVKFLAMTL